VSSVDWFVGGVAIAIGLVALVAALRNDQRAFALPKLFWLDQKLGRGRARLVMALIGAALIALGTLIALGYSVRWLGS
jgi:hypothetical protein